MDGNGPPIPDTLVPEQVRRQQRPAGAPQPASGSMLAALRDAAGRQREVERTELDLPGKLVGRLRVRYHAMSEEHAERYAELAQRGQASNMSMNVDLIEHCAEAVLGFNPATQQWEVLEDEDGPVLLEGRLARMMGLEDPAPGVPMSSQELIRRLYMPGGNAMALGNHVNRLITWMNATAEELEPGKSLSPGSGATRSETSVESPLSASPST